MNLMLFFIVLAVLLVIILTILVHQFRSEQPKNIYRNELYEFNKIAHIYYDLFLNPRSTINLAPNKFEDVMTTEASPIDGVIYNYVRVLPKLSQNQRLVILNGIFQHHTFMTKFLQCMVQDQTSRKWRLSQNDYDNALPIFSSVLAHMAEDILNVDTDIAPSLDFKNIYAIEIKLNTGKSGGHHDKHS